MFINLLKEIQNGIIFLAWSFGVVFVAYVSVLLYIFLLGYSLKLISKIRNILRHH
jgi:hypothetical protein